MKAKLLPDNILRRMAPEQRRSLGKAGLTATERNSAAAVRWERDLHKLICNELNRRGIFFVHARTDKKSTIAVGAPDFCFVHNGKPYAIEIKLPGEEMTPKQIETAIQMSENGWRHSVAHSFDEFKSQAEL